MALFKTGKDYREGTLKAFRQPGMAPTNLNHFLDQIEANHEALQPQIAAARRKVEQARQLVVSRDEIARVMDIVIRQDAERIYGPIFKHRIEAIWTDPDFSEAENRSVDPCLDLYASGQGPALALALYYLIGDDLQSQIKKRVAEFVPASAKGTLAGKRKAIAAAESELAGLERQASDLLSQYRQILDDRFAVIGDHRNPQSPPLMDEAIS